MATSSSSQIHIDRSAPGTVLRAALVIEALANILGGTLFLLYPHSVLSRMVANPNNISTSSRLLAQAFGVFTYALTPQLLLAFPNTVQGVESRRTVYWNLLGGEAIVIVALAYKALIVERGRWLTPAAVGVCVAQLGAIVAWRLFALLSRPAWFGRYTIAKGKPQEGSRLIE